MHKWMTHCCLPVAIWCRGGCPESVFVCVRVTWCDCHSVRQQTEASFSNPRWAVAYKELMQRRRVGGKKIYSLSVYSQGQQAHPLSPPEQILKETSLPANLMHKHSKADKENV